MSAAAVVDAKERERGSTFLGRRGAGGERERVTERRERDRENRDRVDQVPFIKTCELLRLSRAMNGFVPSADLWASVVQHRPCSPSDPGPERGREEC